MANVTQHLAARDGSSWLETWRRKTGSTRTTCCVMGCSRTDLVGGHVMKTDGRSSNEWWLVSVLLLLRYDVIHSRFSFLHHRVLSERDAMLPIGSAPFCRFCLLPSSHRQPRTTAAQPRAQEAGRGGSTDLITLVVQWQERQGGVDGISRGLLPSTIAA